MNTQSILPLFTQLHKMDGMIKIANYKTYKYLDNYHYFIVINSIIQYLPSIPFILVLASSTVNYIFSKCNETPSPLK